MLPTVAIKEAERYIFTSDINNFLQYKLNLNNMKITESGKCLKYVFWGLAAGGQPRPCY